MNDWRGAVLMMFRKYFGLLIILLLLTQARQVDAGWKAGTAKVRITPSGSMWMAGYAARKKPSEGVALDLNAKALAIEDEKGTRLVFVTLDLIGVPRSMRESLEAEAEKRFKLPRASLLLNASHTHCGPELRSSPIPDDGSATERQKVGVAYMQDLHEKILGIIGQALDQLAPAKLDYQHARCGFAMNRRRPTATVPTNAPHSDGPVDHDVPVLRVTDEAGKVRAVLFGYACHNTTLSFLSFCGDYAGYAQECLENDHEGMVALFMTGCGGDQNPYPRGKIEQCQQHGRSLANAVEAAFQTVPEPIDGALQVAYDTVQLNFAIPPYSREELMKIAAEAKEPQRNHAQRLLKQLEDSGTIKDTYTYPIQVAHIGDKLLLVALAGETVVDYSLRLKRELAGPRVWVAGYSNDIFGYVPSLRVLQEGGYEAAGAMLYTSLAGPFAPSVEERIVGKVLEMARPQAARR